jgi:hypothetical protein
MSTHQEVRQRIAARMKPSDEIRTAAKTSRVEMAVTIFVAAQIIALTVFQKVGIPIGDKILEVCLPAMVGGMAALTYWLRPKIDVTRAVLYGVFCIAAFISSLFQTSGQSATSFMLALLIYFPFIFYYEVSPRVYRKFVNLFINAMLIAGAIVIVQHIMQLTIGWRSWPNLDKLLPQDILMPNYVYIQPINSGSPIMKPNGIFFLEVSLVSQFAALALILELLYFQRLAQTALLLGVLVACFAGTGLLMLALTLPFLLTQFNRKIWILIGVGFLVALVVAYEIGWFKAVHHRFTEYQLHGSSSNQRFIAPWLLMMEFMRGGSDALFTGWGAGSILKARDIVWWPLAKVTVEYGVLTSVAFHAFLIYAMFVHTPNWRASVGFLLFYSFMGGGFLVPVYPLACLLFCCLFRLKESKGRRRSRESSSRESGSRSDASRSPRPATA